jgi:hypothetical protein
MTGNASLYMDRGAVIADGVCGGTEAGHGGGNIAMISDNAKLVMVGGTIRDGHAKGTVGENGALLGGDGGNINMNRGTVVLRGGYIVDGTAQGNGGGIYVGWNSTMDISGDVDFGDGGSWFGIDAQSKATIEGDVKAGNGWDEIYAGWKSEVTTGSIDLGNGGSWVGFDAESKVTTGDITAGSGWDGFYAGWRSDVTTGAISKIDELTVDGEAKMIADSIAFDGSWNNMYIGWSDVRA